VAVGFTRGSFAGEPHLRGRAAPGHGHVRVHHGGARTGLDAERARVAPLRNAHRRSLDVRVRLEPRQDVGSDHGRSDDRGVRRDRQRRSGRRSGMARWIRVGGGDHRLHRARRRRSGRGEQTIHATSRWPPSATATTPSPETSGGRWPFSRGCSASCTWSRSSRSSSAASGRGGPRAQASALPAAFRADSGFQFKRLGRPH